MTPIRITVWNEFIHEKEDPRVQAIYPDGIHEAIAQPLRAHKDFEVRVATLDEADNGLPPDVLDQTDVLFWWGHRSHGKVEDVVAERVQRRVLDGMGLVALHSSHVSKPFLRLLGTSGGLYYREAGERERLWVVAPGHPIVEGFGRSIVIEEEEMYGEFFDVPEPDELIFISWFAGGEVFRSGITWQRGKGSIFYFRPGHETYPTYHQPEIQRVLANAARWAAFAGSREIAVECKPQEALEPSGQETLSS